MLRRAARQTLKKGDDSLETIYLGELYMENDFYKSVSFFFSFVCEFSTMGILNLGGSVHQSDEVKQCPGNKGHSVLACPILVVYEG